jgi:ribonucleoside-diphosphate reductase alpha chain
MVAVPEQGLSEFIWQTRYRDPDARPAELEIGDTWKRVANAVAAIEREPGFWAEQFLHILQHFRFLPGGRILAGAGTLHRVTLCNCFVMSLSDAVTAVSRLTMRALTCRHSSSVSASPHT